MSADSRTTLPHTDVVSDQTPDETATTATGRTSHFSPLRWARRRLSRVDQAALVLVVAHLVPVGWLVVGGGLYLDDLRAQAYARSQPFWSFVISSNGTHLAPLPRTLDWLQARYAPLEHWPAVVVTLAIHLGLGLAAWLLLRELVGRRPAALVPLALLLLSPALLGATAWYRQALTTLSTTALLLLATWCAVRHVRTGRTRWLVGTTGLVVAGLLCSERAIAGCALVVTAAAAVGLHDRSTDRERGSLVRAFGRPALLAAVLAVAAALYLWAYRSGPFDEGRTGGLDASDYAVLLGRSLGLGVVPTLFGGPWRWSPTGPALSSAEAPVLAAGLCCAVLLVALAARCRRRRDRRVVLGAVMVAAAYILPVEAFVLIGRYAAFGPAIAHALRLFADCAVVLTIALGVAFLGLDASGARNPRAPRRITRGALALTTALVVATGTALSWSGFAERWHTNKTSAYITTLRGDLAAANRYGPNTTQTVLPGSIPDDVIPGWMQTEISTLDLVALLRPSTEQAVGDASIILVSDKGHLVAGELSTVQAFEAGDSSFCPHRLAPNATEPLVVRSPTVVDHKRDELIELGLLVNDETSLRIDILDARGTAAPLTWPRPTTLTRGPYVVRLRVPHDVDVAAVRVHPTTSGLCVVSAKAVVPKVAQ